MREQDPVHGKRREPQNGRFLGLPSMATMTSVATTPSLFAPMRGSQLFSRSRLLWQEELLQPK